MNTNIAIFETSQSMDDFMLSTLWLQVNLGKRDKEITPHNSNKKLQKDGETDTNLMANFTRNVSFLIAPALHTCSMSIL
jgi:hypothetical protein